MPSAASDSAWFTWTSAGGETSFSTPHAAGVAADLLSYADTTADTDDNQNEAIRAMIVNSTMPNINDNNGLPTTGALYNVARGYGRIDGYNAYQTLSSPKITPGSNTTALRGWAYSNSPTTKHTTSTQAYSIYAAKNQRLLTTLAWNRKVTRSGSPGFYSYTPTFYNLNLQILDPNRILVVNDTGTKDNLKKWDILLAKTGYYSVKVSFNNTTGSSITQDYGLAFQIIPPIAGDYDLNYVVDANDLLAFVNTWLLETPGLPTDLAPPFGQIDFADFAVFAQNWLASNPAYYSHP